MLSDNHSRVTVPFVSSRSYCKRLPSPRLPFEDERIWIVPLPAG
jgi:hypothetical protein